MSQQVTSPEMSRSPTLSTDESSPNRTLTDLNSPPKANKELPAESTLGQTAEELAAKGEIVPKVHSAKLSSLPAGRKSLLLLVFCLAMFIVS